MKPSREELLRRREEFVRRIRRDKERSYIASVLAELGAGGATYELIWPEEAEKCVLPWIEKRFPIRWGRVDWSDLHDVKCARWSAYEERDPVFRRTLWERGNRDDDSVVVVWGNGGKPCIHTNLAIVSEHCRVLLDADFEIWVFAPDGNWLIEYYYEGELWSGVVSLSK